MLTKQFHIEGPLLIASPVHQDKRGYFMESFHARKLIDVIGFDPMFVQDNLSNSSKAGTLRGLHLQKPPFAQSKLVHCITGAALDIMVDVRCGSPTYGESISTVLSAKDGQTLWIPEGFLHGFLTREDNTVLTYKTSAHYNKDSDITVRWGDPDLRLAWGVNGAPILSSKDANAISFADFSSPFALTS